MPRIQLPVTPETTKINIALTRADQRVRKAAIDCETNAENGTETSWERTVSAPMRGNGFLSVVAVDSYFCGAAYPDTGTVTLTYDMKTGAPVNWARLMPPKLVGKTAISTAGDSTPIGTLSSAALRALYVTMALKGMDADMRDGCKDALGGDLPFIVWMDAKRDGVAVEAYDLPHVVAACASDEVISTTILKQMGADPGMIAAIEAAHKAHAYDDKPR